MELEHVPMHHAGDLWNWNTSQMYKREPTRNTFGDDGVGILRRPKRITRNQIGDDTSIPSDANFTRIELR